uniref:C2 domain-containing protein n=1 Tax=Heligmosomoides polygyrus TaxID=6339 RepID=A0A8L8PY06_HELPZ
LYISSCIEKDAHRLTINLKKADDLPRWSFLGAPGIGPVADMPESPDASVLFGVLMLGRQKKLAWDRLPVFGNAHVCIKITMAQGEKQQTKSSRILKSTTTAVYNEAVMFLFGTTKKEIDSTKITITVHDMQRTCTGDDVIGCAYLGAVAHDKSEMEQWKNTVEHMGKEYKGTHNLKPPHQAPPVHVAETGDVDGDD